ncbi:hypothetical protein PIIN_10202 [Serendipita indica DSM 11827]|uniref:Uncharacterized protein n=1 Tax=Serendipita indica (strain DSM 11827) TaxID=1109443 RepID=G4TY16_SERID|nr:hypothetical protein PIIN_10202 [Serendipita indica DSM 11827]
MPQTARLWLPVAKIIDGRNRTWFEAEESTSAPVMKENQVHWFDLANDNENQVFVKPKNSRPLPVESQRGFMGMHKQISTKKGENTIIVKVTRPEDANATALTVGSAVSIRSVQQDGKRGVHVQGSTVFDQHHDDDNNVIKDRLKEIYAIGMCEMHPTIHCFHHAPTNLHWELNDIRLTVWATRIAREEADELKHPVSSHFTQKTALGTSSRKWVSSSEESNPSFESGVSMASMMQMIAMQNTALLGLLTRSTPIPTHSDGVGNAQNKHSDLDAWGAEHNLSSATMTALEELGFVPGDNLEELKSDFPDAINAASIKPAEWSRAVKASESYRRKAKMRLRQQEKESP